MDLAKANLANQIYLHFLITQEVDKNNEVDAVAPSMKMILLRP